jgi:hypothetical protein
VISKDCFTYLWPNRQIIVGFFIKLSDSVLKSTESLNKSKGAVITHINASSDVQRGHYLRWGRRNKGIASVTTHCFATWLDPLQRSAPSVSRAAVSSCVARGGQRPFRGPASPLESNRWEA